MGPVVTLLPISSAVTASVPRTVTHSSKYVLGKSFKTFRLNYQLFVASKFVNESFNCLFYVLRSLRSLNPLTKMVSIYSRCARQWTPACSGSRGGVVHGVALCDAPVSVPGESVGSILLVCWYVHLMFHRIF